MNSFCKQISGIKGSDMSIPPILHSDNLIFYDIERANLFNIYFSKQSEIDDSNSNIPNLSHVTNQISDIKLCENEVEDVLKVMNPTKASGPDLINPRLLKEAAPIIKHPLCKLFNLSLRVPSYPNQWKRANITPVFKNNKQTEVKNYRPISLLRERPFNLKGGGLWFNFAEKNILILVEEKKNNLIESVCHIT